MLYLVDEVRRKNFFDEFTKSLFQLDKFFVEGPINHAQQNTVVDIYSLTIELPGYNKSNTTVKIDDGILHIVGTINERKNFHKTFMLPKDLNMDKTTAEFVDGILSVKIPKIENPKSIKWIDI